MYATPRLAILAPILLASLSLSAQPMHAGPQRIQIENFDEPNDSEYSELQSAVRERAARLDRFSSPCTIKQSYVSAPHCLILNRLAKKQPFLDALNEDERNDLTEELMEAKERRREVKKWKREAAVSGRRLAVGTAKVANPVEFLPPYPSVLGYKVNEDDSIDWVSPEWVHGQMAFVDQAKLLARTGELLNCHNQQCQIVVRASLE